MATRRAATEANLFADFGYQRLIEIDYVPRNFFAVCADEFCGLIGERDRALLTLGPEAEGGGIAAFSRRTNEAVRRMLEQELRAYAGMWAIWTVCAVDSREGTG